MRATGAAWAAGLIVATWASGLVAATWAAGAMAAAGEHPLYAVIRVGSSLADEDRIGARRAGLMCLPNGVIRWGDVQTGGVIDQREAVQDALEDAGVAVTPLGMVDDQTRHPARRLRAMVRGAAFDMCARHYVGDAKAYSGDATLEIEWRLESADGSEIAHASKGQPAYRREPRSVARIDLPQGAGRCGGRRGALAARAAGLIDPAPSPPALPPSLALARAPAIEPRRSAAPERAGVAELVDAAGLGPAIARCGGSSPFARTRPALPGLVSPRENHEKA